jgi:hypothetical protein
MGVFYLRLSHYSTAGRNNQVQFNKEEPMRQKHFTLPLAYLSLLLPLLGYLSVPAAAQPERGFFLVTFDRPDPVTLHHSDGSISRAEFGAEMILYPDGRANGGWGFRELGSAPALTLYRVVEGQATSDDQGPFFEFKAQRLSPLPGDGITIILRRLANPKSPLAGDGSVTFVDTTFGTFSFVTQVRVIELPPGSSPHFNLAYIHAPPQTVVVQTPSSSYTAYFTNVALVFPSGGAIGTLTIAEPEGSAAGSNQGFGRWEIFAGHALSRLPEGKYLVLRARPRDTKPSSGDEITILLGPDAEASEPCRIYDIVGPQVGTLHFEAQVNLTLF